MGLRQTGAKRKRLRVLRVRPGRIRFRGSPDDHSIHPENAGHPRCQERTEPRRGDHHRERPVSRRDELPRERWRRRLGSPGAGTHAGKLLPGRGDRRRLPRPGKIRVVPRSQRQARRRRFRGHLGIVPEGRREANPGLRRPQEAPLVHPLRIGNRDRIERGTQHRPDHVRRKRHLVPRGSGDRQRRPPFHPIPGKHERSLRLGGTSRGAR
mmetsp:Transcript_24667/g.57916  ORF Transcript_24667/g.57916 Transcript_24667/m.57916 type:complete len:210 (+) Transcript_24667:772-1401(+)